MKTQTLSVLQERIGEYKRKFYLNQLVKGVIFAAAFVLSAYLFVNTIEYFGRFSSAVRGTLFFGFLAILGYALARWVVTPLVHLYGLRKSLSDEEAAGQIGNFFPEIGDKLLNTLQLRNLSGAQTDLIEASIQQKSKQLLIVRFSDAVKIDQNRRYLKYAIYPLAAIGLVLLINPRFFANSSDRIIHFEKEYNDAPFTFKLDNKNLKAFRNEDFTLQVSLAGGALPEAVYVVHNKAKFKLEPEDADTYSYTFKNVQRPIEFQFEAAGYKSSDYKLLVAERPNLLSFDVTLQYPAYLGKPAEQLSNVGNLTVPEGTTVTWDFNTDATEEMALAFEGDKKVYPAESKLTGGYEFQKNVRRSGNYEIKLKNDESDNREKISYFLNVINDKHPTLTLENYQDTTLYNYFVLGGNIADDYGFSNLRVFYNLRRKGDKTDAKKAVYKGFGIPFNKSTTNQTFYFQWYVDSLRLTPGDRIEYYVQVWDNDGVNGPKSAKSRMIDFAVPSKEEVRAEAEKSAEKTEAQINKTLQKAKSLQKELEKLDQRLKSERELDFQDKKQIEDLLKKREELMNDMKSMQEQAQTAQEKQERFAEQSPEMKQKMEQLQKLMKELLDPETKKLYDQLEKLLQQQQQDDKMQELMNKLKNKEFNAQKEIEKALEMFKQLQLQQKAEQIQKDLNEMAEKQEKLAEKTEKEAKDQENKDQKGKDQEAKDQKDKDGKEDSKQEELKKEQEELNKEFEETKKDIEELEKLNEELADKQEMDTGKEEQQEVDKEQQNSSKQLQQKQNKNASQSQKKAAKSMKKMAKQMQESMESAEMQEMDENMDNLRDILENLIHLSFDQERVMKDFRGVNLQDPRFIKLAQEQLKLQDDAKVIEDSLYALAKRVMQIQTFVTRELNDMKFHMTESTRYIRERRLNMATSKQQFAMTSINNLSLMLSQTLQQMQAAMMAMASPGSGSKKGNKGKGKSPGNLGELQKQLNNRIQQLQKGQGQGQGGMGGRQMSEQLAQMAAEQARIRQMLKELMDSQKGSEGGRKVGNEVKELMDKMDETETDLVNKRINPTVIKRQEEIITRLLESEKALRQQEEDTQRKSETAKPQPRNPPAEFEQYVKDKQRQTELLRTVPPSFAPFYKREADNYFKKTGEK
ncbi:DUF4175 family protein [Runella slithyformis]|uniref:ATPase n=1 Tax=Runella slithyformis (strain ATCC 29530 / DSM 19594 / LMG 11500 / NCIMB 11436 / LSU 4) TaxID=761193 RepID=A0A7U4E3X8_RUNSL|nr:DUF4175 family protein [Runella slithyformis]AEI46588.1 hypothetical protein Runsl_0130 [Runella slithyformis DSM 19594]